MKTGLSLLDFKLGVRMMVRYPGLSLVSVLGMAVAIAIATAAFAVINTMVDLPLGEGDRVVSILNRRVDRAGEAERRSLHDFAAWRGQVRSVRDLAAFRTESRNLLVPGRGAELVQVAEVTASGFRVARVAAERGRTLVDDDERPGAPPVVVIAHEEWLRLFGADPRIVGRTVQMGSTVHTVVGVMPKGFRFPVNHRYWTPLRLDPSAHARGEGPALDIFGRLAADATLARAGAELAMIGRRTAAAFPATHGHLRPRVYPYTYPFVEIDSPPMALALRVAQLMVGLLVVLVAVNVAILIYARTAARMREITVRTALGASRPRVVTQLFVEALVLALAAAAVGLAIVSVGFSATNELFRNAPEGIPFWMHFRLTPGAALYAISLAVLAGAVCGVLPALKATGTQVQARLQQFSAHGAQMQLGRTWSALIVTQVALAVAVLPFAADFTIRSVRYAGGDPGYPAAEFVRAWLSMDGEGAAGRLPDRAGELLRRMKEEPGVSGVTFASSFPGQEPFEPIEVERPGGEDIKRYVQVSQVDANLFRVFDVPVLAGRGFTDADSRPGSTAVVVNQIFASQLGGSVLGRRIRDREGGWREIVGVVANFPAPSFNHGPVARMYHATTLDRLPTLTVAIRTGGSTAAVAKRLRETAWSVDPALRLHRLEAMVDAQRLDRDGLLYTGVVIAGVTLSVLLLSAAGIYSMMSFTVVRRRREIGIRAALGADPARVLRGIFARACAQIAAGVAAGLVLSGGAHLAAGGSLVTRESATLWALVAVLMTLVGVLATLGPARRGLRIEPVEALRADG
jgi:predicted permease